jgi:hypothetical protein
VNFFVLLVWADAILKKEFEKPHSKNGERFEINGHQTKERAPVGMNGKKIARLKLRFY